MQQSDEGAQPQAGEAAEAVAATEPEAAAEPQRYEVAVTYRQVVHYYVDAADPRAAQQAALERWQLGERGDFAGSDGDTLGMVLVHPAPTPEAVAADAEVVFGLLREREQRLLEEMGRGVSDATTHDAVSATEVAFHLGWVVRDADGRPTPHIARAARALEHLCGGQRAVCFARPRVRSGERGDIRLYCTREHLDALSRAMEVEEGAAGVALDATPPG